MSFDEKSTMRPATEIDRRVGLDRANCCNDRAAVTIELMSVKIRPRADGTQQTC